MSNHFHNSYTASIFSYKNGDECEISVVVLAGSSVDPVNYFGNEHICFMIRKSEGSRETEDISVQEKRQISLSYNVCQDEASDQQNLQKGILSLGDNIRTELHRQKEELDKVVCYLIIHIFVSALSFCGVCCESSYSFKKY